MPPGEFIMCNISTTFCVSQNCFLDAAIFYPPNGWRRTRNISRHTRDRRARNREVCLCSHLTKNYFMGFNLKSTMIDVIVPKCCVDLGFYNVITMVKILRWLIIHLLFVTYFVLCTLIGTKQRGLNTITMVICLQVKI